MCSLNTCNISVKLCRGFALHFSAFHYSGVEKKTSMPAGIPWCHEWCHSTNSTPLHMCHVYVCVCVCTCVCVCVCECVCMCVHVHVCVCVYGGKNAQCIIYKPIQLLLTTSSHLLFCARSPTLELCSGRLLWESLPSSLTQDTFLSLAPAGIPLSYLSRP